MSNNTTPYSGFFLWHAEMERLQLWPRMDEVFEDRLLEGREREAREQDREALRREMQEHE